MAENSHASTSSSTITTLLPSNISIPDFDHVGTSNGLTETSNSLNITDNDYTTTTSRPQTSRRSTYRPNTSRPRSGYSTWGVEQQEIMCAVSESRGISPSVGLAFVNLETGEAVLSQINDRQTYVHTLHKLSVFSPSMILIVASASDPKSKLYSIVEDSLEDMGSSLTLLNRKYWAETTGLEYIQHLAFAEDADTIRTAVVGKYYAVCCLAAVLKFTELALGKTFPARSLRIKYEPPEGSMMINVSTIQSLELVQNLNDVRSKACLFGLLNETFTPMGARLLRTNILQPLTNSTTIGSRWDALEELSTKEEMFFAVRSALKPFLDVDKILTQLIIVPVQQTIKDTEQAINNVIILKQFVGSVKAVFEALTGARSLTLQDIRNFCASENNEPVQDLINGTLNEDTAYAKQPLDLRNQRTYAVKSGVNGLLDVARQTYKEAMMDCMQHITDLKAEYGFNLQTKYDNQRHFYMRLHEDELEQRNLPAIFINAVRKRGQIECTTLELMKRSQKVAEAHMEVLLMSDKSVAELIAGVRGHMFNMFKICESVALLDMLASFAQVVTTQDYVRPSINDDTFAIRAGRHPIREKIEKTEFVPNDVYADQQARFQIVTGCNMSGKSTYIRSVALMAVMAQIGCFVPASFASFPITRRIFARVSMDDNIEANVSTFAAEMRETAFVLRNLDQSSIVIIDELGRGTSTRDGLAIALAISEAFVESKAFVWFATHFADLASIMAERNGVVNLHLAVDSSREGRLEMLYRISSGVAQEKHYGLKIAKVVPLPLDVIEHAKLVSHTLEQQARQEKTNSYGIIETRKRKLLLGLKKQLIQAKKGTMSEQALKTWLKNLQDEFVLKLTEVEREANEVQLPSAEMEFRRCRAT